MGDVYPDRVWKGFMMAVLIASLPGCVLFQPKEDPQIASLQRKLHLISQSQTQTQEAVQDVCGRLEAIQNKVTEIEAAVENLAKRPEPMLITPEKTSRQPEIKTAPPKTGPEFSPTIKKRATVKKKRTASSQRSPKQAYDQAYAAYGAYRYDEALALFNNFLQDYPRHPLADNAQYWVGEIYYDTENYPSAILAFKEVVTKYVKENKAPDALLKIGFAYVAMDDPRNARIFLKRVIKNYPFSEAEARARAKLKELENL